MSSTDSNSTVTLIGSGAVANSLGVALLGAGFTIDGIISASLGSARELGVRLGVPVTSNDFSDLRESSDLVFVCVPDAAIDDVAGVLATLDRDWKGALVAHTSGAIPADALKAVADRGADVLSFHPLQSFPSNGASVSSLKSLQNVYFGLEGSDAAVARGTSIVEALGARVVRIPTNKKEAYHLAATIASNLFVAVVAMADEILVSNGLEADAGASMFLPLIEGTLENLKRTSPERALTGPIARGDVLTVRKHLDALRQSAPHLLPVYASLSTEVVRVAVRGGQIGSAVAEDVLDTLHHGLSETE